MHDLTGKSAYDDIFRKTHAPLYFYFWFQTHMDIRQIILQRCMSFTEKIVVGLFSVKVMHSGKVMSHCTWVLQKIPLKSFKAPILSPL